jgi:hypothetical protein
MSITSIEIAGVKFERSPEYLLVVVPPVESAKAGTTTETQMERFLTILSNNGLNPKSEAWLETNVWQIPFPDGLPLLARLICSADDNHVRIRVLFLSEKPAWQPYIPAKAV